MVEIQFDVGTSDGTIACVIERCLCNCNRVLLRGEVFVSALLMESVSHCDGN